MQKLLLLSTGIFVVGTLFLGSAQAQTPASNSQQPAAPQAPATTPKKAPAAKTAQTPAAKTQAPMTLETPKEKLSYAIGVSVGMNIKRDELDVDTAIVQRAIKDVLAGNKLLLSDQEVQSTLTTLQTDLNKKRESQAQQAAEANKKEGDAFLAANKGKEGVVALPSGLQYKILQEGTGPKPTASDTVMVNYRGTLINGTEFDSSYKRGQAATFGVGQVIRGWTEALQLMPVGSKWQIFIPSDLAYGPRGAGRDIGPNATLIFEVELLSIQPKAQPAPAPAAPATAPANPTAPAPKTAPTPTPTPKP